MVCLLFLKLLKHKALLLGWAKEFGNFLSEVDNREVVAKHNGRMG